MKVLSARSAAAWLAVAVAAADLAQVLLLAWRPKHWGAIGGAVLYAALALGIGRGHRAPLVVVAAMPALPLTILALSAAGAPLPVAPDAGMVGVLALQLMASAAAVAAWRR